jgi:AraC-like DNA-binding protein
MFLLVLQLEGTSTHRQNEREAKLTVGDFTMCASTCSNWMSCTALGRCLVIEIPDRLMRRHVACADDIVAVRMSGSRGITGVLSNFIRNFWSWGAPEVGQVVALRLSYTLMDLIAAAYSASPHGREDRSSLAVAHRVRILGYIETHLRDPNLDPTMVARGCKITARYVHHLFASGAETVTQYIQRRRLEECARALVGAPEHACLVTEIAFDYGFHSLTHFGRVFRHQFGLTPSEFRRAARH